jgi:hypothetical protein
MHAVCNSERSRLFRIARDVYESGQNVVNHLVTIEATDRRTAIEIAYALQSGTYTDYATTDVAAQTRREGHALLGPALQKTDCRTLLDCGAGEGTRWLDFDYAIDQLTLLDVSWSRLSYASANLAKVPSVKAVTLVKADMLAPPFAPASFDAVFTSHAVEPNTDEAASRIIEQLFALARRLVVMFEPNYRDAEPAMRARMERHGYAKNIWDAAHRQPGWTCIREGAFKVSPNPDNKTSYMVFARDNPLDSLNCIWTAPMTGRSLRETGDGFVDEDGCFAYPRIGGIACLAEEDGVFIGAAPPR